MTTLRFSADLKDDRRVEFVLPPEVPTGPVSLVVIIETNKATRAPVSMLDLVEPLPPGPRAFPTWAEYERHLREEKDSWER
jgi:hypothetical protein